MPDIDGFSVMESIRNNLAEDVFLPIMIITADANPQVKRRALSAGAQDFLTKPFDGTELLLRTMNMLERRFLHAELANQDQTYERKLAERTQELDAAQQEIAKLVNKLKAENLLLQEKLKTIAAGNEVDSLQQDATFRAFFGAVSHSLKGELLHIDYSIQEIKEFVVGSASPIHEECDIIDRSVKYSEILLRRLLLYLQVGIPQMEPVKVTTLVEEVESLIRPRLPSSVTLSVSIIPHTGEQIVNANFEDLMGVVLEIMNNSTENLRGKDGSIVLKVEHEKDAIVFLVSDNGSGIPTELQEGLLHKPVKSMGGSGVGLYLSNQVVQALGGQMSYKTSSQGTTFCVSLPVATEKESE